MALCPGGSGVAKAKASPERPRRTREHVIASQSYNYIEKFFIDKGHTVDRPSEDYGYDLIVNTFDTHGYAESGDICIQLKASDRHRYIENKSFISFEITRKHYELWMAELMPVFLVLYDAQEKKTFWLYVQEYFAADPSRKPKASAKSLTVRVPIVNQFAEATVEFMRESKGKVLAEIAGKISHGK
jgi:hypothetical protein